MLNSHLLGAPIERSSLLLRQYNLVVRLFFSDFMKTCYDMSMFSVVPNFHLVMFLLYDRFLAVPLFAFGTTTILVHPFLTLCAKLSHNPSHIFPKILREKKSKRLVDAPVSDEKVCAKNTPQRCEFNSKHVLLYVGHLYKPFWTKKIGRVGRGGQGRSKYCPEWASFLAFEPYRDL